MTEAYREGEVGQKIWCHQKHEFIKGYFPPSHSKTDLIHTSNQGTIHKCNMDEISVKLVWTIGGGILKRYYRYTDDKMVHWSDIPKYRKVIYAWFVCDYITHKEEYNLRRITVGGDRLEYPGDVSTKKTDITKIKFILNSVLSNLRA